MRPQHQRHAQQPRHLGFVQQTMVAGFLLLILPAKIVQAFHHRRLKAGFLHGYFQCFNVGLATHDGGMVGEIDIRARHPRHGPQRAFHLAHATRAAHAQHRQAHRLGLFPFFDSHAVFSPHG